MTSNMTFATMSPEDIETLRGVAAKMIAPLDTNERMVVLGFVMAIGGVHASTTNALAAVVMDDKGEPLSLDTRAKVWQAAEDQRRLDDTLNTIAGGLLQFDLGDLGGDFDRSDFDRSDFDRSDFDRSDFDRSDFDRSDFDRSDLDDGGPDVANDTYWPEA